MSRTLDLSRLGRASRYSLFLLSLVGSFASRAWAIDLIENIQLFGGYCDAVPGGPRAQVMIDVSDWKALSDGVAVPAVLNAGRDFATSRCPGVRIIAVFVKSRSSFPFGIDAIWLGGDQWNVTRNNAAQLKQQEEAQNAERQRQQAEAARQAQEKQQALAAAKANSQKLQTDFIAQTGIQTWVNVPTLKANPFPYQGKIVGFMTTFQQMVGSGEALFGGNFDLVASGVPNTLFTQAGMLVVIAIQVNGIKQVKVLGTDVAAVDGTYKGAYICKNQGCSEFVGPH